MLNFENVAVCHKTHIGLRREKNEDSYTIIDCRKKSIALRSGGKIFAVADGMGGHPAGEVASDIACHWLAAYFFELPEQAKDFKSPEFVLNHLENAFWKTHKQINKHANKNKSYAGMGTTLSALFLAQRKAYIAHVGDSRIYRLRHDFLEQLTEDDTMAQLSVEMGHLTPEESTDHPLRHALTQAMGQNLDEVHTRFENVKAGDILLLCSDGLHDMIRDDEIKKILLNNNYVDPSACDALIDAALKKGGKDNVTVIVVRICET